MRTLHATALALVLVASAGVGAADPIRIPVGPVVPQPMPTPTPRPDAAVRLAGDALYVIDSDTPVIVLASPAGLVSITEDAGPIKVRGRFVDGLGKVETRTFKGKQVVTVEGLVSGRVELLIVPVGATKASDVIRRTIDVDTGTAPIPPPQPKPEPKVDPKPVDPAPIPVAGLRVLIVYESADLPKMLPTQSAIIFGAKTRAELNAACVVGDDGKTREWRMWDKDVDTSGESALWQTAFKRPRQGTPWVLISNGKAGFEGPLPANVDDFLTLLKKYGG